MPETTVFGNIYPRQIALYGKFLPYTAIYCRILTARQHCNTLTYKNNTFGTLCAIDLAQMHVNGTINRSKRTHETL